MALSISKCPKCGSMLNMKPGRSAVVYGVPFGECPKCRNVYKDSLHTEVILREIAKEPWEYFPMFELGSPKHQLKKEDADESLIRMTCKAYIKKLIQFGFFNKEQYDEFYNNYIKDKNVENFDSIHSCLSLIHPTNVSQKGYDELTIEGMMEFLDSDLKDNFFEMYNYGCELEIESSITPQNYNIKSETMRKRFPSLDKDHADKLIMYVLFGMRMSALGKLNGNPDKLQDNIDKYLNSK